MTTALQEIVDRYEERVRQEHADRVLGVDFQVCEDCAADRDLISRARAELAERIVDPVKLINDYALGDKVAVKAMTAALRAQGIPTTTTRKDESDG